MLKLILWVHLLSLIGTFGGLLAWQCAVPGSVRHSDTASRAASRLFNALLGAGLLAGFAYYLLFQGYRLGGHYNGVIGLKFILLLAVGALLGMSRKPDKGDLFRTISLVLLAVAALAGVSL